MCPKKKILVFVLFGIMISLFSTEVRAETKSIEGVVLDLAKETVIPFADFTDVKKIRDAIFSVKMDGGIAPVILDLNINGVACSSNSKTIPITTARYESIFKCGNAITPGQDLRIKITPDISKYNPSLEYKIIYEVRPKVEMKVQGTDYYPGANATIFVQLISSGDTLDNQSCKASVINKNRNGFFLQDIQMINFNHNNLADKGLYYIDFNAPSEIGVYPVIINCTQPVLSYIVYTNSYNIENGTEGGSISSLRISDDAFHILRETISSPKTLFVYYNFTDITGNLSMLYEITMTVEYASYREGSPKVLANENFTVEIFNFATGQYEILKYLEPREQDNPITLTASIKGYNISKYVSGDKKIRILINDTIKNDTLRDHLDLDVLYIGMTFLEELPIFYIPGSGELNVMSQPTPTNLTTVLDSISGVNQTVLAVNQSLQSTIDSVLNFLNGIDSKINQIIGNFTTSTSAFLNSIASAIWSWPERTTNTTANITVLFNGTVDFNPNITSYFNGTVLINNTIEFNPNITSYFNGSVWVNVTLNDSILEAITSVNDTLKNINQSITTQFEQVGNWFNEIDLKLELIIGNFSSSVSEFITNIAQAVWNYPTREVNATNNQPVDLNATLQAISEANNSLAQKLYKIQDEISSVNKSVLNVPGEIWGYPTRTLTEFNATIIGGNLTVSIDPAVLWNYPNRTMSQFCKDGTDIGRCVYEFFWKGGAIGGMT